MTTAQTPWKAHRLPASTGLNGHAGPAAFAREEHDDPPAPDIPIEWAADMGDQRNSQREIVQGILTAGGLSVVFGVPNSGKSYLVSHLGFCMTKGTPWLGKRVEKGAVLYIAGEGAASIRRRVRAHETHYGCKVGAFGLIPEALSLLDGSADVEALIPRILAAASEIGEPVLLVVVDTLACSMAGADENSGQDMGRLVAAGNRIREKTGAHVLFVHHAGKDSSKGARGHSSLNGAIDTELEVVAEEALQLHTATVTKQRDGAKGMRMCGRFVPVTLGVSQWGDPITACAVEDADAPAPKIKTKLGPNQRALLALLKGVGRDMRVPEIAEQLEISRTAAYNSVKPLAEAGLVEICAGVVHFIRAPVTSSKNGVS